MNPNEILQFQSSLLAWYRADHRKLPWRETREPYRIWLSEIMLQQTQVNTVLPYYERFLALYPTLADLARAPIDEVLKAWEGLGYYSRARNLHKAANRILDEYGGQFPSDFEAIEGLPGIGRSTAGAISTFAFATPKPILDGNLKRVLARVFVIDEPLGEKGPQARLWECSEALLPSDPEDAFDFNQAMMELGATLCSPKAPQCDRCPVAPVCEAQKQKLQETIPVKAPRKTTPHYTIGVGVVWKDDRMLIALRPQEGLLGGLWEFPGGKCQPEESLKECVAREILEETGLEVQVGARIAEVKHAYSHFKITLHAFACRYVSGEAQPKASQELRWVTLEEIDRYAFPKANKRVLEALHQNRGEQLTLC